MTVPATTVTVGQYLARRLVELGGTHLFGLPGDFNLSLLDEMLEVPGIEWVGNTNELNAAYAADAYARTTRGVAALVTTYGVGELSAVNGIAGSCAEDVPVVQITGMPDSAARARGALLHHSLADGDHDHFARAYREVTATGAVLRAADAALEIDRVLRVALETSKPVYLAVPADVAVARVNSAPLRRPLHPAPSDPVALDDLRAALAETVADAAHLTVLAGTQVHRRRAEGELAALADRPGVRVASLVGAKAMLAEEHPASLGTYQGAMTIADDTRHAVDEAELLVLAGTVLSDVMTGLFSHGFDPSGAVQLGIRHAVVDGVTFHDVRLEDSLRVLGDVVLARGFDPLPPVAGSWPHVAAPACSPDEPLTQNALWSTVQSRVPEHAVVVADAGTSLYGSLELRLPAGAELLVQPIWSSIGYTLPAVLGTCLAAPERRSILFIGDGAAQLTAQEIATVLHRGLRPVVVVVDNSGYTIERVLQSPKAVYQDVTAWNWLAAPAMFAPGVDVFTADVRTPAELARALDTALGDPDRAAIVQVHVDADDVPPLLARLGEAVARLQSAARAG
ncbi:alpha-keto acid decarboxylase family protein [Kineococcus rhizosphaerae]|uniref:Alpha-keto-acid decarboxylase n=1 Tax=Kineococcus rhizosphaerae TaxID=559628 RepID=A0A2T0R3M9_9ACTN|nr:thiamine pyrophosphate-binding protein [Kineococcus rhizosphaerae]PRY14621.1 indolepyruvate decarboxylase [Kineococcus rhizosphaerae]